jgi:hypothetical protein
MPTDDPYVEVASFTRLEEAEVARLALESVEIPCAISATESVAMGWLASNAGGVKILVPRAESDRAYRILQRLHSGANVDDYGLAISAPRMRSNNSEAELDEAEADEDGDEVTPEADKIVDRAFYAAVFGFLACPLAMQIYSLFVLMQLSEEPSSISPSRRFRFWIALAVDLLTVGVAALMMVAAVLGPIVRD